MYALQTREDYCPYCAEPVQLVLDTSMGPARYVEDCQVCCQPMTVCLELSVSGELMLLLQREDDA